jgi:hypothetical protein
MAGSWDVWRSGEDGTLRAEARGLCLVVHPANAAAPLVRFGVVRRGGRDGACVVGSGHAESARAGKGGCAARALIASRATGRGGATGAASPALAAG